MWLCCQCVERPETGLASTPAWPELSPGLLACLAHGLSHFSGRAMRGMARQSATSGPQSLATQKAEDSVGTRNFVWDVNKNKLKSVVE